MVAPNGEVASTARFVAVSVGAVLSSLTVTWLLGRLLLPAASFTVRRLACTLTPSVLSVSSCGQVPAGIPEPPSAHVKWTTTLAMYQPAAFGPVVAAAVIVGMVLSIRTVNDCGCSWFPASSVAKKVSVVAPSVVSGTVASPPLSVVAAIACAPLAVYLISLTSFAPSGSEAVSETVTAPLFQPAAFAAGCWAALVVGAVVSVCPACVADSAVAATSLAVRSGVSGCAIAPAPSTKLVESRNPYWRCDQSS